MNDIEDVSSFLSSFILISTPAARYHHPPYNNEYDNFFIPFISFLYFIFQHFGIY